MQVTNLRNDLNESRSFVQIVKYELTARNAAIHVVGGSGNKEARFSRHGRSPMRGRDNPILLSPRHNAEMRRVRIL